MQASHKPCRRLMGFTLIELLIVVAIIAILAAIAVPNFLEAQTRAKVSRTKADMRSLATAVESYRTDYTKYPFASSIGIGLPWTFSRALEMERHAQKNPPYVYGVNWSELTTPVAYLTSLSNDVFKAAGFGVQASDPNALPLPGNHPWHRFTYSTTDSGLNIDIMAAYPGKEQRPDLKGKQWIATSLGPDRAEDIFSPWTMAEYDPTNGTVSQGDITRSGP